MHQPKSLSALSLKKNMSWTFVGNVIYSGAQWLILVVLSKLGSVEMVGRYALALAIVTPIMLLTNLQLRVVQATDASQQFKFTDYLSLRLITTLFGFSILVTILIVMNYSFEVTLVTIIVCIAKIVESISDVFYGLMQQNECMDRIAKSKIIKGILSPMILGLIMWLTKSLVIGVISLTVLWLMVLVFYDFANARSIAKIRPKININNMIKLIKLSLPLGIVIMMSSLNNNIPRYFIEHYYDEKALGYFSALVYLVITGSTIINSLGQSASPRLAKYYSTKRNKEFINLTLIMVMIGVMIGIIGVFFSFLFKNQLLTLLYGEDYAMYSDVFILLMIAGAMLYTGSFVGYSVTAARAFKIQPIIGGIWVSASALSSFFLIPKYGLEGAAYVVIITAFIQLVTKMFALIYVLVYRDKMKNYS
ncbi:oligosaccharide flippase family protein [Paenibacillus sp. HB172176]|uniref:oligosaccharide flippase family protein n=1 Tax=Paenibacillus sp. HB172176 TaxID=2493690 RepID=UPI00143940AB|nr:oligosaccharide flippase family protein [Paenibacillus sp. HB172176]